MGMLLPGLILIHIVAMAQANRVNDAGLSSDWLVSFGKPFSINQQRFC